jgi:D-alanyl-D-alanine carboxypeptidase/D-alanyl-D-alanine-endopeptidase (penicillin-binding protein 4)
MLTKPRAVTLISFLLLSALIRLEIPATIAQQQPQRERRVATPGKTATPALTPTPPPSPVPIVTPDAGPAEIPRASPRPTPAPSGVAPKTATTTRTLAELQARISEVLRKPDLTPAMVGIKVSSLQTGRILFEENADKLLRPASNMKLYTVAAALDRLSPDYHFVTSVYAPAKPDVDGAVKGDLIIYGRGDPSLAARFNNGDYFKGLDVLAERIAAAGVKRVKGDLVGDESYFMGPRYGSGWEWEDLQWWYGAEVSALTVNDNALDLSVKPALEVGRPAVITTGPPDPLLRISNRVATTAKGSRRDLTVDRDLGQNTMTISGSIPVDDKGYTAGVGISDPAQLFVYLLRDALARKGVTITGKSRTVDGRSGGSIVPKGALALTNLQATAFPSPVELVALQSPPLSLIAAQTLKPSQNLYTELILRTLGTVISPETPTRTSRTSEGAGVEVVKRFLREAGLNPNSLVLSDGSGLSRNDMITAEATLQLLTYMHRHRYASVFRDALPIAGVDGTLRNRFKGTLAENNLRAKTGSLSSAASLSGYVTTAAGETLAFSIMVNNFPEDIEPRAVCIDPIAVLLASFAARS